MSNAVWVTPQRRAFRDMAFILFLSSAAKAGSAYVILDMKRPTRNKSIVPCWTMHTGRILSRAYAAIRE